MLTVSIDTHAIAGSYSFNPQDIIQKLDFKQSLTGSPVQGAPLVDGAEEHPVVLFSHGIGGTRTSYSGICTELGSAVRPPPSAEELNCVLGASCYCHNMRAHCCWALTVHHVEEGRHRFPADSLTARKTG